MKALVIAGVAGSLLLAGCGGDDSSAGGQMSLSDLQSALGCSDAQPTTKLEAGEPRRDQRVNCGQVEIVTFTDDGNQKDYEKQVAKAYKLVGGYSVLSGDRWAVMGPTSVVKEAKAEVGGMITN